MITLEVDKGTAQEWAKSLTADGMSPNVALAVCEPGATPMALFSGRWVITQVAGGYEGDYVTLERVS